jgi:hypothetical protein
LCCCFVFPVSQGLEFSLVSLKSHSAAGGSGAAAASAAGANGKVAEADKAISPPPLPDYEVYFTPPDPKAEAEAKAQAQKEKAERKAKREKQRAEWEKEMKAAGIDLKTVENPFAEPAAGGIDLVCAVTPSLPPPPPPFLLSDLMLCADRLVIRRSSEWRQRATSI